MLGNLRKKIISKRLLRIGINMSNFLLVNQKNKFSDPQGLSPDIGKLLAKESGISESHFEIWRILSSGLNTVNPSLWLSK